MISRRLTLSVSAAALLALAGAAAVSVGAADRTVRIKGNDYSPDPVAVTRGDTVTWRNDDAVVHTATADDESWTTGEIAPGDTAAHEFTASGSYPYHCEIHDDMAGTVIVQGVTASSSTSSSTSTTRRFTTSSSTSSTTTTAPTTTTTTTPPTTFALEPLPDDETTTTTSTSLPAGQAAPPTPPADSDDLPFGLGALAALLVLGTSAATMTMLSRAPS